MIVHVRSVVQVPTEEISRLPGVWRESTPEGGRWCVRGKQAVLEVVPGNWIVTTTTGRTYVLKYPEATPEPAASDANEGETAPEPLTRASLFQRVFHDIVQAGSWPHRGAG